MPERIYLSYETESLSLPQEIEQQMIAKLNQILDHLGRKDAVISLFFCSPETSKSLNNQYRQQNKPTDILSWCYEEGDPGESFSPGPGQPWGDLILCMDIVKQQAKQAGLSLAEELMRLLVHGIAHLSGYDHETVEQESAMLGFEIDLLNLVGLPDMYR